MQPAVWIFMIVAPLLGAACLWWAVRTPVSDRERNGSGFSLPARSVLAIGAAMALLGTTMGVLHAPMWVGIATLAMTALAAVLRGLRVNRWF